MVTAVADAHEGFARRPLGGTGVRVTELAFGAAVLGNLFDPVSDDDAEAAVNAALDAGVRTFDTAPYYGYGLSEERLGRALRGARRDEIVVSTKVGRRLEDCPAGQRPDDGFAVSSDKRAVFDYSRDAVLRSVESSLGRLGLDRVDVLLLHDVGALTHGDRHPEMLKLALDQALPAIAQLKAEGVCRAIGIGVNEEAVCLEIMPRADLDAILLAGRYTLLEQGALNGVMAEAERRGVGIMIGGPFNSGLTAGAERPGATYDYKPADADVVARAQAIYDVCREQDTDTGAAALQFPLAHPAVACVVAGLRSPDEVRQAVERLQRPLPGDLWTALREAGLLAEAAPTP